MCRARVNQEDGVVESSLVFIPLLVLFLISMQLIATVNFRNIDAALVQGQASQYAITEKELGDGEIVTIRNSSADKEMKIVVTHKRRRLFDLLSGLPQLVSANRRSTDVTGVAVMEISK